MPTIQEIIAKRNELGAGATNVDARKALESVAPVVTTPTPPVPTVSPTLSINQAQREANIANRQSVTPTPPVPVTAVTPQAPAPTPTNPVTNGVSPVTQTAPTELKAPEPVKPLVAKTEAPIDYTQAKGRESEITSNLDSFKAKGMTPDEIMRASDYANASPEKKALIEPYLKQQVPTASAMYNAIVAKADIPEEQKLTPSYKIAQNRYTKANMFSGMTPSQLANEMKNVKLVEGSQAFEDLKAMNPKLVQDATNLRKVNGETSNIWTYTNNSDGTPVKTNNLENTFANDFNDNFGEFIKSMYQVQTPEQIRAIIYTPDVQQAEEKAKSIELDINKIDDAIATVDKDVEAELSGSGATGSRIALEKASRKDKLNEQRASLERNYTTYANKANNLITQNTSVFQTQQQQKQAQNAAMLPFITDQYKTEQAKKQAEAALQDPATQIGNTMEEFANLGIIAQGSLASKVADANNFIANGGTLGQYINKLRSDYMAKPEYQKILSLQQGQMSDVEKMKATQAFQTQSDIRNFAQQKEMAQIAKDNARSQFLWEIENDPEKKAKALELEQKLNANKSLFDVLGKNVGTYEGNRGYDLAGKLGDPLPAGGNWTVKSIDTAGEQAGSIFIGGKGSKPYGNTVVMKDENGNEIRYSHLQNIGVKPGDVLGFGDIVGTRGNTGNVKGANGETLTAEQLASGRGAHLDVEIKNPQGKLLSNADQVNFLKSLKIGGTQTINSPIIQGIGREFVESGKTPTEYVMKSTGLSPTELINQGVTAYIKGKNEGLKNLGIQITDTAPYITASDEQRKNMSKAITSIPDLISKIDRWKTLVDEYGTEMESTNVGAEMKQLRTDVLTTLKSESFLNLGVLQPVDLKFMEGLVPNSNAWIMPEWNQSENLQRLKDNFLNKINTNGKVMGITPIGTNQSNTSPTSNDPFGIR